MSDGEPATDDPPTLPLVSAGERETIETTAVSGIGGPVVAVSTARRVHVHDAVETAREEGFDALSEMPIRELLDRIADAGRRFEGIGPDSGLAPVAEYERRVARATGLPVGWVHTSAHWLGYGLRHAAESLRAQSPTGALDVYDDPAYTRERNVGLAFAPRIRVLGGVMPGNDPAVYAWPALAVAMKIPVVLRPSRRDPFTAVRLARALLAAGVPASAVHVLPGPREVGSTVVREADHALVFGDESATGEHRDDPAVETYGPGRSVAVVAREPTDRQLDSLARGITRAGGRTCFNLTRIVAVDECDPDALADDLAASVADVTDGPPTDPETDVPAFPDRERARRIDERADAAGRDVTAQYRDGPRYAEFDDHARLAPTVVRTESLVEELPFPFAGVTSRDPDRPRALLGELDGAYLGVAIGEEYERAMARSPRVRKVYGGTYPAAVDLRETHETFLVDFCYERTTYDPS
ncbi:MAG: aldehyde dehydrogenase family protein [Haloarculaceae archaeon]